MRRRTLILAALIGFAAPAQADSLLEKMRSVSSDGVVYAFEMAFSNGNIDTTGKVDPSQAEGERITIYTPDESEWSDEFRDSLAELDAEAKGEIWCSEFAEAVPANATELSRDADTVTYQFTPEPDADADGMEKKLMKKLIGKVTLAKSDAQILAYSMRLPKPFKPAMVAKINAFDMQVSCARAPDGRTYNRAMSFNISGSAMMQDFEESISREITKLLDPVG